jgi:hypothetical protein
MRPAVPPLSIFEDEGPPSSGKSGLTAPTRVWRWTARKQAATAWRTTLGLIATAAGLLAAGVPLAIGALSALWFGLSGASDPPLLWFMLAAVLAWLAGVVFVVAAVLACFRSTRALGIGYMAGSAIATVLGVIGFAVLHLVALAADGMVR